jgi:hypothetical protein
LTEESFSESCSDLDLHNEMAPTRVSSDLFSSQSPRFATNVTTSPRFATNTATSRTAFVVNPNFSNPTSPRSLTSKPAPAIMSKSVSAKPNRAFALRQTNSTGEKIKLKFFSFHQFSYLV